MSEADKKKSEEDQSSSANKVEKISPAQQIAENECQPEPSELSSIDPDDTLNAVFSQVFSLCLVKLPLISISWRTSETKIIQKK